MTPPKPRPSAKNTCVAASRHTLASSMISSCRGGRKSSNLVGQTKQDIWALAGIISLHRVRMVRSALFTLGVNMCRIPSTEPLSSRARTRKQISTT
ncbi:hypothetical protein EYF80_032680 [Liparis tanakae]|uniref:Uncharacterized protein n=1 Tax=Liparis tanakae TaxID=230148 RepID=A0A4Z2GVH6_9TELE|nr:hypothetical protein EYF80_032680 [Liparis tanakae]